MPTPLTRDIDHLSDRALLVRAHDHALEAHQLGHHTADKVATIEGVVAGLDAFVRGTLHVQLKEIQRQLRGSLADVEEIAGTVEDLAESTAQREVAAAKAAAEKLEAEARELRKERDETRRYWTRWVVGIFAVVAIGVVAALAAYAFGVAVGKHSQAEAPTPSVAARR